MDNKWAMVVLLLLLVGVGVVVGAKPRVVVLANSIDFELASDFYGFLGNKGMEVIHSTPADFEQYKGEKFIVILGGPDAPEGVGEIVQEVLSESEQNAIREKGKRKKYVKTNPWGLKKGQRVTVLAGSDRNQTKKSHEENRDAVSTEAEEASEPEETPEPTTTAPPTTTPAPTTTTPPTTTAPPSQPQLSVSISVAVDPIVRGNNQTLILTITDGMSPVSDASVSITVTYASGSTKSLDCVSGSSGECSVEWLIGGNSNPGTFSVSATATKSGYESGNGSTSFSVVGAV